MAHLIDTTTGRAAVFVVGEAAWHKLGVNISEAQTSDEAISLAGLDWNVEQWELLAVQPDDRFNRIPAPSRVANVRTDTNAVLGVVSPKYRVFQNREAFDFMDTIVGEKLAMFETAGSLKGGRRVWMMARIPGEYRAGSDDVIHPYVLLTNTHDGSQSLRMLPTTVRVVCMNTLNLALSYGRGEGLSIEHRRSLDARVEQARQNLGIITSRMNGFETELDRLIAKPLRSMAIQGYFRQVAQLEGDENPTKTQQKMIEQWQVNLENERNNLPGISYTPWAAFNSVSEWADHQARVMGKTSVAKTNNRLNSMWFGAANEVKQRAYSEALKLVN